jgi:NAD(P)-dependent dehydrogenase (short-subunit alcohol dehydrogenase family)
MSEHQNDTRVAIVGGSSGIGFATAQAVVAAGGSVILMGRSGEKLDAARTRLDAGDRADARALDMTDEEAVAAVFGSLGPGTLGHLVVTASSAVHGPFSEVAVADVESMFASKFFGPYRVARAALPALAEGGSITLFSGVLSRRPGMNCSGLGAVNGAVEALTRGLALELGPRLRVNCISPGMVRSEAYDGVPEDKREEMYAATGDSLPVGRVGTVDEVAQAVLFSMSCHYLTGQILDIDGGHMIRQYATR